MTRLHGRRRFRYAHGFARRGFTLIELLVILLLVVVFSTMFVACRGRARVNSNSAKCASNLRQIGQAILLYSNDNRGAYPRTMPSFVKDGAEPVPVFGTGVAATQPYTDPNRPADNDVTAALFMLLRTQDITSEVFTCPSSAAEKDTFGSPTWITPTQSNFTDFRKNLSYSYQNPYARQSAIDAGWKLNNSIGAEYAVAADLNPGIAGGDNVLGLTPSSSAQDMKRGNSNNHEGDGQLILYGDGHVAFESNPFVGVSRDNIYTTADGKILASPVDANDSILLPTDD